MRILVVAALCFTVLQAQAALELQKIAEKVYAIVGEMSQRSPENLANNATFGLIITTEGLVLVDPGGSREGAAQLQALVKTVSSLPVKWVINTGGQDHRWLGNQFWAEQGATVIASQAAVADQKSRGNGQLSFLYNLVGEQGMAGTEPYHADQIFEQELDLSIGGVELQLRHWGAAHTPGDSVVYLPQERVLFSGDIVYLDRMLGVGPQSNSKSWLEVYAKLSALQPQWVVPGHGRAAGLEKAEQDTHSYLLALRERVGEFLDEGGNMEDLGQVDLSEFDYLLVSDQLGGRNVQQVFQEMEFE